MKYKPITTLLLPLLLLASCDRAEQTEPVQSQILRSISATRSGNASEQWKNGDKIALFSSAEAKPQKIVFNGSTWMDKEGGVITCILPATLYGVYPASDKGDFIIPTNQSSADKLQAADWMTTDNVSMPNGQSPLSLNFKHMLAKVEITITGYKNEFGGSLPTISNPRLLSVVDFRRKANNADAIAEAINADFKEITPLLTEKTEGKHTIEAVIAPNISFNRESFSLMVNGVKTSVKVSNAPSFATESGKVYHLNLTVGKDLLTLSLAGISDFTEGWNREVPIDFVPPKIGDYLYDDGTWGEWKYSTTRKAIGVVFSTKTTENDQKDGYYNGYALAMREIDRTPFKITNTTDGYGNFGWNWNDFLYVIERNRDGRAYTKALDNDEHPAIKATIAYKSQITKNISSWASGWFIPSYGQWCEIITNLAGGEVEPKPKYPTQVVWKVTSKQLNDYFKGKNGALEIDGKEYWTSSYNYDKPFTITFSFDVLMHTQSNTNKYRIRPAIAF